MSRAIADQLGRAASTISRELRRGGDDQGRYLPATAQRLAVGRRARSLLTRRVERDEELCGVVCDLLAKRWSPEQIAHELVIRFPDQPERQLCTESIYQAIYDPRVELTRPARRRRRRRRRQLQGLQRAGRIANMTMIADRPAAVDDRVQVGLGRGQHHGGREPFCDRNSRRTCDPLCDPDPRVHRTATSGFSVECPQAQPFTWNAIPYRRSIPRLGPVKMSGREVDPPVTR